MIITDDLIQWLFADKKVLHRYKYEICVQCTHCTYSESVKIVFLKVCDSWRQFAGRLGLESFIPAISSFRETNKLKILFDVWKEERLDTYNVKNLKAILSQEVENNVTIKSFL